MDKRHDEQHGCQQVFAKAYAIGFAKSQVKCLSCLRFPLSANWKHLKPTLVISWKNLHSEKSETCHQIFSLAYVENNTTSMDNQHDEQVEWRNHFFLKAYVIFWIYLKWNVYRV